MKKKYFFKCFFIKLQCSTKRFLQQKSKTTCIYHDSLTVNQISINNNLRANEAGVKLVMEMGVDPGVDHMLAMECFDDIKAQGGKVSRN